MRKLKFRAWSEEQKKFIQGYPLGEDQKNGFIVYKSEVIGSVFENPELL